MISAIIPGAAPDSEDSSLPAEDHGQQQEHHGCDVQESKKIFDLHNAPFVARTTV